MNGEEEQGKHEHPTANGKSPAQLSVAQTAAVIAEAPLDPERHDQHREQQKRHEACEEPVVVAVESGEREVGDVFREVFPEEGAATIESIER